MGVDLQALARIVRNHPGVAAKAEIGLVSDVFAGSDWLAGPGDDGAVVTDQGVSLVVGGEAILPSFVAADPYGAGAAAVTTNLNDLAARGAWPRGPGGTRSPARVRSSGRCSRACGGPPACTRSRW